MANLKPRKFQAPIIDNVCEALDATGRALIVMATGTGKTLTAAFAVKRQIGTPSSKKRVLVLAHMNAILEQLEAEFRKLFPRAQVGRLYDQGSAEDSHSIVYANFVTMRNCIERGEFTPDDFEMVIVDEGHHAQADMYRDVITFFKPKGLIGMTATPDRMDGRDIRQIFGEPVAIVTLAEAMARGYVTPVTYKLMSAEGLREEIDAILEDVRSKGVVITKKELERRLFRKAADNGFLALMDELPPETKAIIFADSIPRTNDLASKVPTAKAYHSDMGSVERTALLTSFRLGDVRRLITVDALNEGVDVPDADVVVFLRSTQSLTIFLQQLGRGLRLAPGKERVTVYDFVGNVQRLQMLRDFLEEMKAKRTEQGDDEESDGGCGPFGPRIPFDDTLFDNVEFEIAPELIDILKLLDGIEKNFYSTLAEASEAARKLGITDGKNYKAGLYKEDPMLPSNPNLVYADWTSWSDFLEKHYKTLAEASAAARKLGIRTGPEYSAKRKGDPKLPSTPKDIYPDWTTWPDFLDTNPYTTLAEASAAARKLGIRDSTEYDKRYKSDPKLSSVPYAIYPDWTTWPDFLDTNPYTTLAEASAAARKLGVKIKGDYQKRYKEDPHLLYNPQAYYEGWVGWPDFLGTGYYATLAEASAAARKLAIRTGPEYRKGAYKQDPKLPSEPHRTYVREWTDWFDFLGTKE